MQDVGSAAPSCRGESLGKLNQICGKGEGGAIAYAVISREYAHSLPLSRRMGKARVGACPFRAVWPSGTSLAAMLPRVLRVSYRRSVTFYCTESLLIEVLNRPLHFQNNGFH